MNKCKCSACKNPKKKLPHPVKNCTCKKCKKTKRLPLINDEGIEVPVTSSGSDKHGNMLFQETNTSSDAVTFNMDWNNKLPIDGDDYGNNRSSEFFAVKKSFFQRIINLFIKN